MALSTFVKKAGNLLGFGGNESLSPPPLDGEIIYCKNNVCVHPPASLLLETEHHPGYLTLKAQQNKLSRPTLILTWVPNTTLKKNPHSIESSPAKSSTTTPRVSPRRNPKQEFAKSNESFNFTPSPSPITQEPCSESRGRKKNVYTPSDDSLNSSEIRKQSRCNGERKNAQSSSILLEDTSSGASIVSYQQEQLQPNTLHSVENLESSSVVQNNEKSLQPGNKPCRVGVHVNDLKCLDHDNVQGSDVNHMSLANDSRPYTDDLTTEEQLVVMLNRKKLHAKMHDKEHTDTKPVSIEMTGDKLCVVTEQQNVNRCTDHNINHDESKFETSSSQSTDPDTTSLSSDSNSQSPSCSCVKSANATVNKEGVNLTDGLPGPCFQAPKELHLRLFTVPPPNTPAITPDISITEVGSHKSSSSSSTTSGPDSRPLTPCSSDGDSVPGSLNEHWPLDQLESPGSYSSSGFDHNLTFPENAMSHIGSGSTERRTAKEQICGVFSVDLGEMRSLRLFYNDRACTQGQVVIASRESQYKILHFHNGGLDKMAQIFEDWSLFALEAVQSQFGEGDKPYRQFLVVKPHLTNDQCHPEENLYPTVTDEIWQSYVAKDGSIEHVFQLRKAIFFGGLEPSIRHEVWPFLLHYYPFKSTHELREQITNDKYIEYQNFRKIRESMDPEAQQQFWRSIQCIVEKDVVRTDRSHPYFRGENNPNIEVLKNILLNYAVANPLMGYTQGMSDLLAPVLAAVQQESMAFWCFSGLMTRTIFVSSPKDSDMDHQLKFLRELYRVTLPKFHYHLKLLGPDAMELLFCHRWILLCFKREFCEDDALRIWEACWARYQTDYFHLFVCVAIVAIYGDDVVEQRLPSDEILLHFSSLAMHMNGPLVLIKARGLLHEFRKQPKIPCTLYGLCSQVNAGMWDSGHVPTVECIGHLENELCPYNSTPSSPVYGDY